MRNLSLLAIAAILSAGCVGYPSGVNDRLGQAVRLAQAQQVIDTDAPLRERPSASSDGQAAKSSIDRYQKSFDNPPPPANPLSIGLGGGTLAPQ